MADPLLTAIIEHAERQYRAPKPSMDDRTSIGCVWGPLLSLTIDGRSTGSLRGYIVPIEVMYEANSRAEKIEKNYQYSAEWAKNDQKLPNEIPEYRLMFKRLDVNGNGPLSWIGNTLHDMMQRGFEAPEFITLFSGDLKAIDTTADMMLFHRVRVDSIVAWRIAETPRQH